MLTTLVLFIIVLGILVFVHELGHFIVARLCGVGVEVFSLGFGKRLFGIKRGLTDYRVSLFPLGGYVKMIGEEPDDEVLPEAETRSFSHKPRLLRALIAFAGPASNCVLGFVVFWALFASGSLPVSTTEVMAVKDPSPAQTAGLQAGDRVLAVNGKKVRDWGQMANLVQGSDGNPLTLGVLRAGKQVTVTVTPAPDSNLNLAGETTTGWVIGIEGGKLMRVGPADSIFYAAESTWRWVELTGWFAYKMATGVIPAKAIGGPIQIARETGKQAREGGGRALLYLLAVISINLALINLLPVPILDGGHILFLAIEGLIRRPIPMRAKEIATQVGLFALIFLMAFAFYNDSVRLITSGSVIVLDDAQGSVTKHLLRLESEGKHVLPVGSAPTVLTVLNEEKASGIDAVILDESAAGENLPEVLDKLSSQHPNVPVILIQDSASSTPIPNKKTAFFTLTKPFTFPDIMEKLEAARHSKASAAGKK
ncbi:MAG: RIP metalloprotease RseP [Thermodesulfobacteriota bacterium]